MKKIVSKLALISVAIAGLFTSCQIEDIKTTFDLAPAVCMVNVKAIYALTGEDITSSCVIENPYGSGASFTVPASANKSVAAQILNIKATFTKSGESQTESLAINTLNPGGVANYSVLFVFGSTDDEEYAIRFVEGSEKVVTATEELEATHYTHGTHNNSIWNYNDTEFMLEGTAKVEVWSGGEVIAFDPEDNEIVAGYAASLNAAAPVSVETVDYNFQVSAWAAYKVWATRTTTSKTYEVIKKNTVMGTEEVLGTIEYMFYSCTDTQFEEMACPGHEAHYVHGHGHDSHGSAANAGGGIVYGE